MVRLRPADFALYSAKSADCRRSVRLVPCSPTVAMPQETETLNPNSRVEVRRLASRTFSAIEKAPLEFVPRLIKTNSSPP